MDVLVVVGIFEEPVTSLEPVFSRRHTRGPTIRFDSRKNLMGRAIVRYRKASIRYIDTGRAEWMGDFVIYSRA